MSSDTLPSIIQLTLKRYKKDLMQRRKIYNDSIPMTSVSLI